MAPCTHRFPAIRPPSAQVLAVLVCTWTLFASGHATAMAQDAAPAVTGTEQGVLPAPGSHDAAVPVGAVRNFIDAARAGDYAEAARHLDLSDIPARERASSGPGLARRLKTVLDRRLWIEFDLLSDAPEGDLADGLPPDLDRLGTIEGVEVLLARVRTSDGGSVWKFAAGTVAAVPELYDRYGDGRLGEFLPEWMFRTAIFGVLPWQGLGLLALAAGAWLLSWLVERLFSTLIRPLVARTRTAFDDELITAMQAPLRLVTGLGLFAASRFALSLPIPASAFLGHALTALAVVAATWSGLRLVDLLALAARRRLEATGRVGVTTVIPLGRRVAKAALGGLALITVLQNLGFNVTGLLAGLGVGGLAIALAAQKSIANLFGGVSLITDQPVRVGDFCRFGDTNVGTVETIGLRSTQVRTLDRTLITIPNSEFSEMQLENFAARDRMRLHTTLGLRYETTPDQLRLVLTEIRRLLVSHPRITADPARVRFVSLGAHSLDVEVFAYVETADWSDFLAVREDILMRIMDVVAGCGTGFAFPSQTLYLGRDGGLDAPRARAAEARVREWRERNELPFPDFPPSRVAAIANTLDYPPRGSAGGAGR